MSPPPSRADSRLPAAPCPLPAATGVPAPSPCCVVFFGGGDNSVRRGERSRQREPRRGAGQAPATSLFCSPPARTSPAAPSSPAPQDGVHGVGGNGVATPARPRSPRSPPPPPPGCSLPGARRAAGGTPGPAGGEGWRGAVACPGLTFVHGGHRCKDARYSWQRRHERRERSQPPQTQHTSAILSGCLSAEAKLPPAFCIAARLSAGGAGHIQPRCRPSDAAGAGGRAGGGRRRRAGPGPLSLIHI